MGHRRTSEANPTGADFGTGGIDDLNDVFYGLDEVGADLRIRWQLNALRVGFSIGKRNGVHFMSLLIGYNLPLYFIFSK